MKIKALLLPAIAIIASATAIFAHDTGAAHDDARFAARNFSAQPPVEMLEIFRDGKGMPSADSAAVRALTARYLLQRSNRPADVRGSSAPAGSAGSQAMNTNVAGDTVPQFYFVTTPFDPLAAITGDAFTLTSYAAPAGNGALMAASFAPFKPRVRYAWDGTTFYEESDNMPDVALMPNLMVGITSWQQQIPVPASYFASTTNPENSTSSLGYGQPNYWRLPLVPVPAASPIPISAGNFQRGAVAIAANGIAIFNPKNNTGAVSYAIGELDAYGGHCGLADDYHYHIIPTHLLSAFGGVLGNDKPVAWALDGYPIYGYVEPDGTARQALDADGGHDIGSGWGYHYHAIGTTTVDATHPYGTPQSPYLMSNFHGTVVNFGGQVDGQPEVSPIRASGTGGYTAVPVSGASIIAFKNPVALTTDGSGNLIENVGGTASADSYLMRVSIAGTSYDECWKINRNVNPRTMTVTWRLAAATTTTTYSPNATGGRLAAYGMAAPSQTSIPDTSQTLDTTATFGEDADYTIHPQSLTDNGNGTITDNVTGLMWQKTDNGESTWDTAVTNAAGITTGGFTDWRLPTPSELFSIFNHNIANPALNTTFFPSNGAGAADYWWTSDVSGTSTTNVWCSNAGGGLGPKPKSETISAGGVLRYSARYVRGAKPTNGHNYLNNGDGTITDLDTGLMWTQLPGAGTTWDAALSYAENLSLGGFSDWRLPNVKELQTLTDYTLENAVTPVVKPSMNRTMFAKTLTNCVTTAGGTTITCADTTGLIAGMPLVDTADIAGTYLPTATPPTVATITNATTFTVSSGTGIVAGSGITLKALAPPTAFWTSTSQNNATANAWVVEFGINNSSSPTRNAQGIISQNVKTGTYPVFAVRTTSVTTQIAVEQPSGNALTDGVSAVSYGNVNVGSTSTKTFVIRNNGGTSLTISGVTIDGTNAANFSVTASPATAIAAGGSTTMDVRFTAASAGGKVAALHIASSDTAVGAAFDVTLAGTGFIPPPTITGVTAVPTVPSNVDTPFINATVTPASGATISQVQLTYSTGAQTTGTVFAETMAATATGGTGGWDGTGAIFPWTLTSTAGAGNIKQTLAANHGSGNPCGLELSKGSATATATMAATTNAISANGTSGYVEFWAGTVNVSAGLGWIFQLSPDGGTTWNTRLSDLSGTAQTQQLYHYDLIASERVGTLKMRFQFIGNGTGGPTAPAARIDDITVVTTTGAAPVTVTMLDDGAHGDGAASDGVYGVQLPAQTSGTTVSYTITATDSAAGTATGSGSYTTGPAPSITTGATLPNATAGGAYSQTLVASGGTGTTYTWSINAGSTLPSGLTLSSAGVLSGTVSTAGTYSFTLKATDTAGRIATKAFTLIVSGTTLPNVVIILTDDQGWADVGYHTASGQVPVQTPNMDALGTSGIRLEKFYPTTVCAVTRGCLLTGRNSLRTNVGNQKGLGLAEHLMPQTFKTAGYQTFMCGKWHIGGWDNNIYTATINGASVAVNHEGDEYLPLPRGWDTHKGQYGGAINYFTHTTADPGKNNALDWWLNGAPLTETTDAQGNGGYSTDLLADKAVAQIVGRDKAKPMLLYLAFNGVHAGVQAPASYVTKYQNLGVAEPRRTLCAAVDCMDVAMGRVLAALESEGITNNTLVVFMSDNGGDTTTGSINLPLRGTKSDSYDGGLHTPAAIRWPGHLAAGVTSNQYVWAGDIFPTVCAAVGVTPQNTKAFDGVNIWPQLQSVSAGNPNGAARGVPLVTGDAGAPVAFDSFTDPVNGGSKVFKVIYTKPALTKQLFNMSDDPYETTDLLLAANQTSFTSTQITQLNTIATTLTADITGIAIENYPPYIGPDGITQTVAPGSTITLYAPFTSYKTPTVQWRKNGANISTASPYFQVTNSSSVLVNGVFMATLTLTNVTSADAASYDFTVTSTSGTTTSAAGALTVTAPALSVTPATGLSASGFPGGPFSPASAAYTVTNSGTGSMDWTMSKTAGWLTLSTTGGTLAASASVNVTASLNTAANSLAAGSYSDTVTFTNTTNAAGNTTRSVSLTVTNAPSAPVLTTLAAFSRGTGNTITWPAVSGATSYTLQIAFNAGFTSNVVSQTVTSPSGTFTNLTSGTTYYYRVLASNGAGSSAYSNVVSSTQDSVAPSVAITSPASGTSTGTNTITVTGTSADAVSGISGVKVNNVAATSGNSFATWSATVPLGFGTNAITATATDGAGNLTTTAEVLVTLTTAQTYNPLIIPDTISGTTFNLTLNQKTKKFPNLPTSTTALGTNATTTYAYNGALMWGPTLIMNKGDAVQMNVTNNLIDTTTVHWHGFHIPAIMDGGPHQTVPAGTTWSPSWIVKNDAATYWYHPHLHGTTMEQLTKGAGGFIIVRDPIEAALALPRTYGVDDFPLALTSRRFLTSNQFSYDHALDNYGDYMLVNGTFTPQVSLPKQYVRLRILNAEIARGYNLGFSDNRTFWVIGNDQGLLNAPVPIIYPNRVKLMVGERVEILVNLTSDTLGSSFELEAYNSGQVFGFPGQEGNPTTPTGNAGPVNGSRLNNADFNILHINVAAATASPITSLPTTLANNTYWVDADKTNTRSITLTGGNGGAEFTFNSISYTPTLFNHTIALNAIEKWSISNNAGAIFGHSFHIHDIKFNIIARSGGTQVSSTGFAATYESGWKDTVYVPKGETVDVIAKYDDFASNTNPFMFHCHFLQHEDGGMMGQFVVVNSALENLAVASFTRTGANSAISLQFKATAGTTYTLQYSADMTTGSWTDVGSVTSDGTSANFTEADATRLSQARGFYRVKIPVITQ